jgi:hypothetical protein
MIIFQMAGLSQFGMRLESYETSSRFLSWAIARAKFARAGWL